MKAASSISEAPQPHPAWSATRTQAVCGVPLTMPLGDEPDDMSRAPLKPRPCASQNPSR
jgi:hypothetical protein